MKRNVAKQKLCQKYRVIKIIKSSFLEKNHIDKLDSVNQSPWKADIQVNDQVVNFKLDSGADVSVLPKLGTQRYSPKLMQIQPFSKESCHPNQNCSPHSSLHGVDIALRDCFMASLLARSHGRKAGRR